MTGKLLRALAAVVVLAAAGLIGWRVLGPAEVLRPASGALPVAAVSPAGVTGKTAQAPLIVAGQVRVYGSKRMVRADAPVAAKTIYTPSWSFRRWPEQLSGMVAAGTTVVTRWSDGELVALDARTGKISWRAPGPAVGGFTGKRVGAATAWAPLGLHPAGTNVLVSGGGKLTAHAVADGSVTWTTSGCEGGFVTAGGRYACGAGAWDVATGAAVAGWPAGPSAPLGCDVARSGCAGLRDASGQGWLVGGPSAVRAPALDSPTATVAGELVLTSGAGAVTATSGGRELWQWAGEAQVLGARGGSVVLLGADDRLILLNAVTGAEENAFPLYVSDERVAEWKPGLWQVTDGFVAIERLDPDDSYYTTDTVIIAAL
ncbi:MAG: PQQ-binding-like beta-propeller repeat protein [Actinoplanes sp.]